MPTVYEWRGAFINQEVNALHAAFKAAGCEYLHVDFEDQLRPFYFGGCGFVPANAGLLSLD